MKCPNCGSERRAIHCKTIKGLSKLLPRKVRSQRYVCLKCGFHYSSWQGEK